MNEKEHFDNDTEITIDLAELFYLFRRKLLVIIAMAVIGGLCAGLFTRFFIVPRYQATAKLYIVSASNDSVVNLADLQIGTNLTADYNQLVLSRPMLESVIEELHLAELTPSSLEKMLKITNPSGTRILEITATSTDPQQAKDIANEMAKLAVSWLPSVMESNEPNIVEEAILPTTRSSPSYVKNTALGALALSVIYFGICVVKYIFNDTIVTPDQMERSFGALPLSSIPEDPSLNFDKSSSKKRKPKLSLFS